MVAKEKGATNAPALLTAYGGVSRTGVHVEAQLDQITFLLWIILVLFGISSVLKGIHFFQHWKNVSDEVDLYDLFERDMIQEVISESEHILSKRPNHVAALWCGAKAYFVQDNLKKAVELATRLSKVEPSLAQEANDLIATINESTANKTLKSDS